MAFPAADNSAWSGMDYWEHLGTRHQRMWETDWNIYIYIYYIAIWLWPLAHDTSAQLENKEYQHLDQTCLHILIYSHIVQYCYSTVHNIIYGLMIWCISQESRNESTIKWIKSTVNTIPWWQTVYVYNARNSLSSFRGACQPRKCSIVHFWRQLQLCRVESLSS